MLKAYLYSTTRSLTKITSSDLSPNQSSQSGIVNHCIDDAPLSTPVALLPSLLEIKIIHSLSFKADNGFFSPNGPTLSAAKLVRSSGRREVGKPGRAIPRASVLLIKGIENFLRQ
jgi:hypothetical protein